MSVNGRYGGKENFPLRMNTLRKGLGVEDCRTCYGKQWWFELEVHEKEKMWLQLSQDKLQKTYKHPQAAEWTEQFQLLGRFRKQLGNSEPGPQSKVSSVTGDLTGGH